MDAAFRDSIFKALLSEEVSSLDLQENDCFDPLGGYCVRIACYIPEMHHTSGLLPKRIRMESGTAPEVVALLDEMTEGNMHGRMSLTL